MSGLDTSVARYLRDFRRSSGAKGLSRVEGFFDNLLGKAGFKTDDPRQRNGDPGRAWIPGLRAQPWFDPEEIPSLGPFKAAFPKLLREANALLKKRVFPPALEMRKDLDYSGWLTFDLRTIDVEIDDDSFVAESISYPKNMKLAPVAAALVKPMPVIGDYCYLALEPGGAVRPHFSQFNGKLVAHLGLSIPERCGIRVAGEVRRWEEGEFLVFDDTYMHDTWNRSRRRRVLFQVGVWHPDLTPLEVEALAGWFERSKPAA